MARKDAREVAMKLLYQKDMSGEADIDLLLKMEPHYSIHENDREYILNLLNLFETHAEEIDGHIRSFSKGWEFSRIAKVDLAILRLALCEILYRDDIPVSVSINEAVELAKKFSNDKSGRFVNGVLGGFIRSRQIVPEQHVMHKEQTTSGYEVTTDNPTALQHKIATEEQMSLDENVKVEENPQ
ncbi:MAG: transcription antitermination factor NusB [Caldicoprobacter sp.]|uniref:transcription antitermination factor NusB n=1 Tax=Caldicoprobacter sp. TaxID=2004500 RepID=UPI001DC5AA9A|nr:transcription antitermination factor NusB [Clostridia bacterium]